jgi:sulfite reductase (NADPH) flavoprotein alpha-component
MTNIPFIPESAPFNAEQRAWLNGFLAGLFSQVPGGVAQPNAAPPKAAEPLVILFGSQTGSAESLAKKLAKESESRGFTPKLFALNDYEQANLPAAGKAVIISSTWGDGEPPDNAVNFWNWLKADSAPRLPNLNFAVLGLGDRNYSDFCGASKKFDERLAALGAKRLAPRGECDVDYEAPAKSWIDGLWNKLGSSNGAPASGHDPNTSPPLPHAGPEADAPKTNGAPKVYSKSNPFPARLLKNVLLNQPGSSKEVRHYEIALNGSGLTYEAGDALGVVPVNCPELVEDVLAVLKANPDENVKFGDQIMSLREALTHHLDVTKPSPELLAAVAKAAPQSELAALLAPERRDDLKKWLWGRHVIDLLEMLPAPMAVAEFVPLLKRLAPRLYSISSSPKAHPGEVHLTVGAVRYESHGRERKGVASTFLADRVGDAEFVKVFVQSSHGFKPPANGDLPMIMVGPGTGIAPFRAFLEERQATGAKGRNWLFFGDQKQATDFLYAELLTGWQTSGFLTRLDLAFSRDQERKIYVQDRMMENAAELWSWLEAGGHFYVCGDASRMAKDVDAALHRIVETAGGKSPEAAQAYVAKLKAEKRYQRDVY